MAAYYNEIDPYAAQWLRNLIAAGHIAPGDVDERSIVDVRPADLRGYRQCHFFAGIGVWSHALRRAGWSDDRSVWTGSCPCQPFSTAGQGKGHEDERHLWPAWFGLIRESRPVVCFGEQVADGDGYAWLDHVGHDLEGIDYAIGALCPAACGFGAPHERQRLFFVAHASGERIRDDGYGSTRGTKSRLQGQGHERERVWADARECGAAGGLEHAHGALKDERTSGGKQPLRDERGARSGLGNADEPGSQGRRLRFGSGAGERPAGSDGAVGGFWGDADWIYCRGIGDIPPSWRPVEPGAFPLAHGITSRMDKVRAYGNAIVAPVAAEFIGAYLDVTA